MKRLSPYLVPDFDSLQHKILFESKNHRVWWPYGYKLYLFYGEFCRN